MSLLLLHLVSILLFWCECSLAITGGDTVQSSATYPFSVTLTDPILCGGSIISLDPPWILTAAHCIEDLVIKDNYYSVAYGNRNFSEQSYAVIKQAVMHPLYTSSQQLQSQVYATNRADVIPYDIGLIKLRDPLIATGNTNRIPILHHPLGQGDDDIMTFETIGMGYTGYQKPHANILQYTQCNSTSTASLRDNNFNHSITLATADAGLCHGDSGSPLLYKQTSSQGHYMLDGVLNRILNAYDPEPENSSCPFHESNLTQFVNAFVRPSVHLNWIMNTTGLSLNSLTDPVINSNDSSVYAASVSGASLLPLHDIRPCAYWLLLFALIFIHV